MKCPLCRSDLDEKASKKLKRTFKIVAVAAIVATVFFSLYSYLNSSGIDMSHDALGLLPNTLVYSAHQDALGAAGGIVAVYGNISNPGASEESWVRSFVTLIVFDGYNQTRFHFAPGVLYGGESLYFSWAYHFDRLDLSSCEVSIRVMGA